MKWKKLVIFTDVHDLEEMEEIQENLVILISRNIHDAAGERF
ncbi:hypothetical protein ACVPOW_05705 [Staphylococcus aureus]